MPAYLIAEHKITDPVKSRTAGVRIKLIDCQSSQRIWFGDGWR
jgi:hypothetical protein